MTFKCFKKADVRLEAFGTIRDVAPPAHSRCRSETQRLSSATSSLCTLAALEVMSAWCYRSTQLRGGLPRVQCDRLALSKGRCRYTTMRVTRTRLRDHRRKLGLQRLASVLITILRKCGIKALLVERIVVGHEMHRVCTYAASMLPACMRFHDMLAVTCRASEILRRKLWFVKSLSLWQCQEARRPQEFVASLSAFVASLSAWIPRNL